MGSIQGTVMCCKLCVKNACTNSFTFRDLKYFMFFFRKTISKNWVPKAWKIDFPYPIVRSCQGTSRGCKSCLQIWLVNAVFFRDVTFLWSVKCFKNLIISNIKNHPTIYPNIRQVFVQPFNKNIAIHPSGYPSVPHPYIKSSLNPINHPWNRPWSI